MLVKSGALKLAVVVVVGGLSVACEPEVPEVVDGVRDRANQALNTGSPSQQDVGFAAAKTYPVATDQPTSITAADLDGDGDTDLATAHTFSDNVSVLINEGDGAFSTAGTYLVGDFPTSVTASDLDGDGDTDLATDGDYDDVSVLINNGDGTFADDATYQVGDRVDSVTAADLDGDGDMDLATANLDSDNASVLINYGDGTFADDVTYQVGDGPQSITAADLDSDGDIDLAAANSGNLTVLLNNGEGAFSAAGSYPVGDQPRSLTATDLDGDGDMDLATANYGSDDVSVLINEGDGAFSLSGTYSVGSVPSAITAADLDGDGDTELATADAGSNKVSVLINDGDGAFTTARNYAAGDYSESVTAADLDGDGDTDLATANQGSNNVSVFINTMGTGGDTGYSDDSDEASLDEAVGDYYRSVGVEEWNYTYDHLDSQTQSMFTEEEWSQKNQWLWDRNPAIYHILSIDLDSASQVPLAVVEVRITGEDGSSSIRTTYFVLEDGEWKHRFSDEEADLFMPDATYEEFVEAQGGAPSDVEAAGVCAGISDCNPVDSADVDGDGSLDEIALVGELDNYSSGPTQITVRVLLADGTTLTREVELELWSSAAWLGATDIEQVPGEELVIGGATGAHTLWYRVLTYRDGELVELPYPDSDPSRADTFYSTLWPIDAAASVYVGVQCDPTDSTVVLRSVSSVGAPSQYSTFEGEETSWVLDGDQWRMTESSELQYPDAASASDIAGWQCGDLPQVYD